MSGLHYWQNEAPRPQGEASRARSGEQNASKWNLIFYCAPRPRLQGEACGALAGQISHCYTSRGIYS